MQYLYHSKTDAQQLDEAVCKAMGWPTDDTKRWDTPTQVEQGEYEGMWYIQAPPEYADMSGVSYPEPDAVAEKSSDWHPEPEIS